MRFVQIAVGVLLILFSIGGYSASLEYYSVVNIKNKNVLYLRAWPSNKSKIIARFNPQAKNIIFLNKRKVVAKDEWMKVLLNKQEGWVNSHFLKKQIPKANKSSNKLEAKSEAIHKVPQQSLSDTKQQIPVLNNRNQQLKKPLDQSSSEKKPVIDNDNMEQQIDRYIQPEDMPDYTYSKTNMRHSFAVQAQRKSHLN